MPNLNDYLDYIASRFDNLIKKYKMEVSTIGPNTVSMVTDKCFIRLSLDKLHNDFRTLFIDPQRNKDHTLLEYMEKTGWVGVKIFSDEEFNEINSIGDHLKREIFWRALFIEKNCTRILEGDFSVFGDSEKTP